MTTVGDVERIPQGAPLWNPASRLGPSPITHQLVSSFVLQERATLPSGEAFIWLRVRKVTPEVAGRWSSPKMRSTR
jgi:hypothetical protein